MRKGPVIAPGHHSHLRLKRFVLELKAEVYVLGLLGLYWIFFRSLPSPGTLVLHYSWHVDFGGNSRCPPAQSSHQRAPVLNWLAAASRSEHSHCTDCEERQAARLRHLIRIDESRNYYIDLLAIATTEI